MAKTFDDYERLRDANAAGHRPLEQRLEESVEQTELLQDVRRRVEAFLAYYEADMAPTMQFIAEQREKNTPLSVRTADLAEYDVQTLANDGSPTTRASTARLTLDDLKILLDQFPQKDV